MAIYADDKPVTKKELIEKLGLTKDPFPQHRRKVMQLKSRTVDDKGTKRSCKSYGGKPEFSVYVTSLQRHVKIRYATSQQNLKDDVKKYTPKSLWLIPAMDGSYLVSDETEFWFWYLHPRCLHSPFHDKQGGFDFEYQDLNADAETEMKREESVITAMSIIVGLNAWPMIQLRQLAKGIGVSGVDDMTDAVIQKKLKENIHRDPVKFYNQATSREVLFTGKIQEAIDRNILHLNTLNGMQRWFLKQDEILPITFGQDPVTELKALMAEKWYLYADKINNALQDITIASMLERPENDKAFNAGAKPATNRIKADLTAEEHELLREIKEKDWLEAKMEKIDKYDLNNPKLMASQRKSYEENKHYYAAWKKAKELEEELETA